MFPSGRRTLSSCQWHRGEDRDHDDHDHDHDHDHDEDLGHDLDLDDDYNILSMTLPEMRGLLDLRHSPHSHSNIAPAIEVYNFNSSPEIQTIDLDQIPLEYLSLNIDI